MELRNSKITGTGVSKSLPLPCCYFLLCHGWINNPCCGRTRTWEDHLWLHQRFPLFEMIMNASLPKQLLEIPICLLPGCMNQEAPSDAAASTVTPQSCTATSIKVPLSNACFSVPRHMWELRTGPRIKDVLDKSFCGKSPNEYLLYCLESIRDEAQKNEPGKRFHPLPIPSQ